MTALAQRDLTGKILHAFYAVYNELGHGFLESVYEASMAIALDADGIVVQRQVPAVALFRGHVVGEFRADLVVEVSSSSS